MLGGRIGRLKCLQASNVTECRNIILCRALFACIICGLREQLVNIDLMIQNVKQLISKVMRIFANILGFIPAVIYGYIYSEYFTKATYKTIADRNTPKAKAVLDIGTATGQPLHSIIDSFGDAKVIGIDYDPHYIPTAQKLFKDKENVTIKLMNFYDMDTAFPGVSFDTIIFGSSFMIMPDQVKAVEIAKKRLSKDGKIYFLQTLYDQKTPFNRFMEKVKPSLKYISTVDFGTVTYKEDFEQFLEAYGLDCSFKERCSGNFFLKYFKFYIYQARIKA